MKRRSTIQRMKILEYLRSVKTHPTAETIHNAVKKQLPTITLATVYRNLNVLAGQKEILKLEVSGECRFDGNLSKHQHCVCRKCGKIIDFFNKDISDYAMKKIKSDEFNPDGVKIIFYGECKHKQKMR